LKELLSIISQFRVELDIKVIRSKKMQYFMRIGSG